MRDHVEQSWVTQLRSAKIGQPTADALADDKCMSKPKWALPARAKMPSWPISWWPKINVNCCKWWLCSITAAMDKVPDVLDMLLLSSLVLVTPRCLSAWCLPRPALQGRSYPHLDFFRLCPWLKASHFYWHSGHCPWTHLLIHHMAVLNWKSYSVMVNTNLSSFISLSFMLGQFCFPFCFWLIGFS